MWWYKGVQLWYIYIVCNINQMRISYTCYDNYDNNEGLQRSNIRRPWHSTKWYKEAVCSSGKMIFKQRHGTQRSWQREWLYEGYDQNTRAMSQTVNPIRHTGPVLTRCMTAEGLLVGETAEGMNWNKTNTAILMTQSGDWVNEDGPVTISTI